MGARVTIDSEARQGVENMIQAVGHQDIEQRVLDLAEHSRPGALYLELRQLSRLLLYEGYSKKDLMEAFERVRTTLQERGQEDEEDTLLEVMDDLYGWCAPNSQIN